MSDATRRRRLSSKVAIREASVARFRPILITARLVALFGALPLALGSGDGAGTDAKRPRTSRDGRDAALERASRAAIPIPTSLMASIVGSMTIAKLTVLSPNGHQGGE